MKLIHAPYIGQKGTYPTGCESVSAVMLLRHLGVDITVDEFIQSYLPLGAFETRDGQLWGPDPRKVFCGSPYDEDGMGCYAPVIRAALERVLADRMADPPLVVDETGTPMEALVENYVNQGSPVVFWTCIDMRPALKGPSWRLLDSGEMFEWISNEHCMLLVGYDGEGYWFNDPYEDHGLIHYPKEPTRQRHLAQRAMAVSVRYPDR